MADSRDKTQQLIESDRAERRAVRALRESEARYRALVEASPEAIFVEVGARCVFANRAAARLLRAPDAKGLIGRSPYEFLLPEQHARARARQAEVIAGIEHATPDPYRFRRLDGTLIEIEASAVRVEWDGRPAAQVIVRDVTAAMRAEAALRESEERYRLATQALRGYIYDRDWRTGAITFSEGFKGLLGRAPESVGISWWHAHVHPQDLPTVREAMRQAVAAGKPSTTLEYRVRHADGHYAWVADHALHVYEGDLPVRTVGSVSDITERKRIEESLRERDRTLQAILDYLPEGLTIADAPDVTIRAVSRYGQELTARSEAELAGRPMQAHAEQWDLYRADSGSRARPEDLPLSRATLHGEIVRNEEWALGRADGTRIPILCNAGPIRDERGQITGGLIAWRDIAELKALQQEREQLIAALQAADRRKDEFLATLAHELRNPLAPLRTAAHVLRTPNVPDRHRLEAKAMIERQVATMTRLVDDLLDMSRVTLGRIELQREAVSVAVAIEQAIEAATPLIVASQHHLTVDLPEDLPWVHADITRLTQVFTNLLTNAAKYTPAGGKIAIGARLERGEVLVCVRDNGMGIPPDMLDRVFEMFTQVSHTGPMARGGLGIGLSLAKRLVEMHGGRIGVTSDGAGRGSEFWVRLPCLPAPTGRAGPPSPEGSRPASPGRRVLVVDDNVDAADSLAMLLQLQGHAVRTAHSGTQALQAVASAPPEVVLLDIGLPDLDGYEVARRIRGALVRSAPLLIALTGWGQAADRARAAEAGIDHHLTKPADPDALARLIDSAHPPSTRA